MTRSSVVLCVMLAAAGSTSRISAEPDEEASAESADETSTKDPPSPWLLLPVVSSNPKLGTAAGGMGAFLHTFGPGSRVSIVGILFQYTSTDSTIAAAFARTSFGADRHRLAAIAAFGYVKNDYSDYLGTGEPLRTNDDLKAVAGRYLFRVTGPWFAGAQGNAATYQVLGEGSNDQLVLETLGVQDFHRPRSGPS